MRILIADPRVLPSLWHHNADGLSPAEASHDVSGVLTIGDLLITYTILGFLVIFIA